MRANVHAEFFSRWAPLSAFRVATRAEDDQAADRNGTLHAGRETCYEADNYAGRVNDKIRKY